MNYSNTALMVLAAKERGIIKTNAQFWMNFADQKKFEETVLKNNSIVETSERIASEFDFSDSDEGIVCVFDDNFPVINTKVKNNGEKPYLLFYRGDLSLLSDLNKNIAVIGLINPDESIVKRESDVVKSLVKNDLVVLSGLAIGCDTVAHRTCLEENGKTIAVLPSQLNKIYPAENYDLADEILLKDGLLISEYYKEAASKYEAISRFVERDRLQAMFSKAVILIASYRQGEGDSGSRHAMDAARKYGTERFVMYNNKTDENNKQFGLNKDFVDNKGLDNVKILQASTIDYLKELENPNLSSNADSDICEQLTFLSEE